MLWRWLPLLASLAVLAVYSGSVSNFLSGSGDGPRPMQLQAATISQPQYEPLSENRLQSLEKRLAELQDTGTTPRCSCHWEMVLKNDDDRIVHIARIAW